MNASDFELTSSYTRVGETGLYCLTLHNLGVHPLNEFRLGVSGPARIGFDAKLEGGTLTKRLSNWCEITPDKGFVLEAGDDWIVAVHDPDFQIHHWTEGTMTACLILATGETVTIRTHPSVCEGSGVERLGPVRLTNKEPIDPEICVIPWPNKVAVSGARAVPEGFAIKANEAMGAAAANSFEKLTTALFPAENLVRPSEANGFPVPLVVDEAMEDEAYQVSFSANELVIHASSMNGFLYGLITLGQITRGARQMPEKFLFPAAGTISDAPSMKWRGCHLDAARRFYPTGEIAQFLNILAWNKLNRFHWHLSDDEAWRVEIDAYPSLTDIGAWRGVGMSIPPLLGTSGERSGGFYTKTDVRQIITHASALGIEIVPEIDVPGHCYAMLEALPELRDPDEAGTYYSIQGFPNNCLNPAVPEVYRALERIFNELCDLFPSRYFHVGADEVPQDAWTGSPMAKARLKAAGKSDANALQAMFLKRVQDFLTAKGKITGAWEEAAQGGGIDKEHCYLVGWHSVEIAQKLAAEGYNVVVSPGQAYYLDMANGPEWEEPGASWAGYSSPQTTYEFVPAKGWSNVERARLLGVQACIWSEPMKDRAVFDRLIFPRLSAIAEAGWTAPALKDWNRFSALAGMMPSLHGSNSQRLEADNA